MNSQGLCGASDWRIPTKDELLNIVKLRALNNYAVDPTYFPNTRKNNWFWSSTPSDSFGTSAAMAVLAGYSNESGKYSDGDVRLVRGGQ